MRLIIDLSQTTQGRLEGSVAHPGSSSELSFEGIVELVGVLEQHLRASADTEDTGLPGDTGPTPG